MPHKTKFVDMKMSKKQAKGEFAVSDSGNEGPKFPHGLSVSLNNDSLKKLDISELPAVGTKMFVYGIGAVTHASEHRRQQGVDKDVTIQLEEVSVGEVAELSAEDAVSEAIKDA